MLSREIKAALASPAVRDRLLKIGMVPVGSSPQELADQIAREAESWGKVIRAANISLE